jgi:hypothetical protein
MHKEFHITLDSDAIKELLKELPAKAAVQKDKALDTLIKGLTSLKSDKPKWSLVGISDKLTKVWNNNK